MTNPIRVALDNEKSLSPEALAIFRALNPLFEMSDREQYIKFFQRYVTQHFLEGRDHEVNHLLDLLQHWERTTPFQRCVVFLGLQQVVRDRLRFHIMEGWRRQ